MVNTSHKPSWYTNYVDKYVASHGSCQNVDTMERPASRSTSRQLQRLTIPTQHTTVRLNRVKTCWRVLPESGQRQKQDTTTKESKTECKTTTTQTERSREESLSSTTAAVAVRTWPKEDPLLHCKQKQTFKQLSVQHKLLWHCRSWWLEYQAPDQGGALILLQGQDWTNNNLSGSTNMPPSKISSPGLSQIEALTTASITQHQQLIQDLKAFWTVHQLLPHTVTF